MRSVPDPWLGAFSQSEVVDMQMGPYSNVGSWPGLPAPFSFKPEKLRFPGSLHVLRNLMAHQREPQN